MRFAIHTSAGLSRGPRTLALNRVKAIRPVPWAAQLERAGYRIDSPPSSPYTVLPLPAESSATLWNQSIDAKRMPAVNKIAEPGGIPGMTWEERRDLGIYRVMRALPVSAVSRLGASLGLYLGRRAHPEADARVAAAIKLLRPDLAPNSRCWIKLRRKAG